MIFRNSDGQLLQKPSNGDTGGIKQLPLQKRQTTYTSDVADDLNDALLRGYCMTYFR